jgi:hypothetical protein
MQAETQPIDAPMPTILDLIDTPFRDWLDANHPKPIEPIAGDFRPEDGKFNNDERFSLARTRMFIRLWQQFQAVAK